MFADDEKDEMEQPEQEEPEKESFDAEQTLLDSAPPVEEEAPAEKKKPPAPKKKKEPAASKPKEPPAPKSKEDDAWQTVASTPAKKAEKPEAEKKEKTSTPPPKAEFAPTRPLDAVSVAEEGEGGGSKVPLGDFMSNLGIHDRTWQIVVLVAAGLVVLCCVCSCLGIIASSALGGLNYY
jgi:outer membrane biosynthesis protein TonB